MFLAHMMSFKLNEAGAYSSFEFANLSLPLIFEPSNDHVSRCISFVLFVLFRSTIS